METRDVAPVLVLEVGQQLAQEAGELALVVDENGLLERCRQLPDAVATLIMAELLTPDRGPSLPG